MSLPLFKEVSINPPVHDKHKPTGHAGLWFDRFYDRFNDSFTKVKPNESDFYDWLNGFNHIVGNQALLDRVIDKQSKLVDMRGGCSTVVSCEGHFISGMGNPHPIENGLQWHPTWGVPYLPASSLKGLVRSWVEVWLYDENNADEAAKRNACLLNWFGSVEKQPVEHKEPQAGSVVFFDLIPLNPVGLVTDIMTPHMGEWYGKGHEIDDTKRDVDKLPADWHKPNPINFLAAKNPVFLLSVAPRDVWVKDNLDMNEVMEAAVNALDYLGAGAKTAVGYGQFKLDERKTQNIEDILQNEKDKAEKREKEEASRQGLGGVSLEFMVYAQESNWEKSTAQLLKGRELEDWLTRLLDDPNKVVVEYIGHLLENGLAKGKGKSWPDLLVNPTKVRGKKQSAVYTEREKECAELFKQLKRKIKD